MLKKIIIWILGILLVGAFLVYVYIDKEMSKLAPEIIAGSKDLFEEVCEERLDCLQAISEYYSYCADTHEFEYPGPFSFYKDHFKHLYVTYNCIESSSSVELPSLGDYFIEEKYGK